MIALALLAAIIATPATVRADIARAACGDTITLAAADFGEVVVANRTCAMPLRLDTRAATLALRVQKVEGLIVQGGSFSAARSPNDRAVSIDMSSRVELIGARVDVARDGIMVTRSSDVLIVDAAVRRIVSNGLTLAGVQRVTVGGFVCSDPTPDPTGALHPDCVQAWSLPDRITADIYLGGVTSSGPVQGIWFGAEPGGFDRVTISRARISSKDAPNGIGLRNCRDCLVIDSIVTTEPGSKWQTTIAPIGGSVRRAGNVVAAHLRWKEVRD